MKFLFRRPFEPFTFVLTNGRELAFHHPEQAAIGRYGQSVELVHPSHQVEVIDVEHIVSLRTLYGVTHLKEWIE